MHFQADIFRMTLGNNGGGKVFKEIEFKNQSQR